ncbi:MAG: GGDEF domain-containing protein [Woeseiaceae bacterium]
MKPLRRKILEQLIAESAEPLIVAQIDQSDWPVVLCNPAFDTICGEPSVIRRPFADVVEALVGRELAVEISETVRAGQETSIPVEFGGREYLLVLKPISPGGEIRYYAAYWRDGVTATGAAPDDEMHQALLKAKRRIKDLSRDDPVTGLLNASAFREVLVHDWAVAAREKNCLALVSFSLDDFEAYLEVFDRHATDSCLRRVAQAIRRCLRRASDVAARLDDSRLIVLSHSSDEGGVKEFAAKISTAVRELGLHHPRSSVSRFVTVSYSTCVMQAGQDGASAEDFLGKVLSD